MPPPPTMNVLFFFCFCSFCPFHGMIACGLQFVSLKLQAWRPISVEKSSSPRSVKFFIKSDTRSKCDLLLLSKIPLLLTNQIGLVVSRQHTFPLICLEQTNIELIWVSFLSFGCKTGTDNQEGWMLTLTLLARRAWHVDILRRSSWSCWPTEDVVQCTRCNIGYAHLTSTKRGGIQPRQGSCFSYLFGFVQNQRLVVLDFGTSLCLASSRGTRVHSLGRVVWFTHYIQSCQFTEPLVGEAEKSGTHLD